MSDKPVSVAQALQNADRLATTGARQQAAEIYQAVLARFPGNRRAALGLRALGPVPDSPVAPPRAVLENLVALFQSQRTEDAIREGLALVRRYPQVPAIYSVLGGAHAQRNEHEQAAEYYARALELAPRDLSSRYNLALMQRALNRLDEAAANFEAVLAMQPSHVDAQAGIGGVLARVDRFAEAAESFRAALANDPRHLGALVGLGNALDRMGQCEEAAEWYRQALQVRPDHRAAHLNLCEVFEKTNQRDAFAAAVRAAEQHLPPDDPLLKLRLGQLAMREQRLEEARENLNRIDATRLNPIFTARLSALLGQVNDRLGAFDEAFGHFEQMNAQAARSASGIAPDRYFAEIEALATAWDRADPISASAEPNPEGAPVFIVGFPRSGTTLLDTILRGHPDIAVIEEGPMVDRMRGVLGALPTPEILDAVSDDAIEEMRGAYLETLRGHPEFSQRRLVIDKLPLNIKDAGLIRMVFPGARFILALRHPCDTVLSCFMQNFALNDAMANFLSIERAARLYDAVMRLWISTEGAVALETHLLRYEDLVVDLKGTITPLVGFLGLDWHDGLADYRQTALDRGRINTPSYQQVTERLYGRAAGRWMNYRREIEPVMPLLDPWIAHFGYDTSEH